MMRPIVTVEIAEPAVQTRLGAQFRQFPHLLHFKDLGLDERVVKTWLSVYRVARPGAGRPSLNLLGENADLSLEIPVLRISGRYHEKDPAILIQVMRGDIAPAMGRTAMLSPAGERLLSNEARLACAAFRQILGSN